MKKSGARRTKVKNGKVIKKPYTMRHWKIMRDNCCNVRDLAMIDLLLRPPECVSVRWLPLTAMTKSVSEKRKQGTDRLFRCQDKNPSPNYLESRTDTCSARCLSLFELAA